MSDEVTRASNEDVEFNIIKQTEPVATIEETIQSIPYHSMKKEFEALGIGSAWSAGTTKADLVKHALLKLEDLKSISPEKTEQEKAEELANIEAKRLQDEEASEEAEKIADADVVEDTRGELEIKYSLEDGSLDLVALERALHMVSIYVRRVKRTEKARRKLLVVKKAGLVSLIEIAKKQ